ncbi:hypothetical protein GF406_04980 [candidate division KSB1 bacterium]|nr:hypothetical protein [candidate division KSB1 bacterium]
MARTIFMLIFLGLLSLCWAADKPDFSGSYTLDETKSKLSETRRRVSKHLEVKQTAEKITITREYINRSGESVSHTEELTLDGKANKVTVRNRSREVQASWSDDGAQLIFTSETEFERQGRSIKIQTKEKWALDGNKLTIVSTNSSPRGERSATLLYTK